MKEELQVIENVLEPEKSYAIYRQIMGGYSKAWGLAIEPRDTLLERARLMAAELEGLPH